MSFALCCTCTGLSCFGKCCSSITKQSSTITRVMYTVFFFTFSVCSWAWYERGIEWYRQSFPNSILHLDCSEDVCFGIMSVYRIMSVLFFFYLIHAIISSICPESSLNAQWWGLQITSLIIWVIVSFFIPNIVFQGWAWIALVLGTVFILVQLVLLVEFAHSWSESCLKISFFAIFNFVDPGIGVSRLCTGSSTGI